MPEPFNGMQDILMTYDFDLVIENGDLKTTTGIDYINREILKLLVTGPNDWKLAPKEGADIRKFLGNINSRQTAEQIKEQIESKLALTVYPATVAVRVVPTDASSVMVFIDVLVNNEIATSLPFNFNFVNGFTYMEMDSSNTSPRSTESLKINDIRNTTRPNKYWARMRR